MTGKPSEYKYQLHCHYSSRYISLVIPKTGFYLFHRLIRTSSRICIYSQKKILHPFVQHRSFRTNDIGNTRFYGTVFNHNRQTVFQSHFTGMDRKYLYDRIFYFCRVCKSKTFHLLSLRCQQGHPSKHLSCKPFYPQIPAEAHYRQFCNLLFESKLPILIPQ